MKTVDVWGWKRSALLHNIKMKMLLSGGYKVGNILDPDTLSKEQLTDGRGVLILADSTNHVYARSVWGVAEKLRALGVRDIYVMPATIFRMPVRRMKRRDFQNAVQRLQDFSEPEVMKYLAYEGCNLNCAGCSHFASVNPAPKMLSMEELEKSLPALKRKFSYVKNIQFLGGEPLMNPDLGRMIEKTHEVFPYCSIGVITNGLLLLQVQDDLLEIFQKQHVYLIMTKYRPVEPKVEEIKTRLDKAGVRYEINGPVKEFRLQYNATGHQDAASNHHNCLDWCCHTIRGNMVGGCYYPVVADVSNAVLDTNLPEDCCFDYTSDAYSGAELLKRLVSPTRMCAYCNSVPSPSRPWHQVTDSIDSKDWFYE